MILKALHDYYYYSGAFPPFGLERKKIAYVIVIDREGKFLRFDSKRIDKKRCATFIVAKGVSRTRAPKPNILWDNGKYVFGLEESDIKYRELFIDIVNRIAEKHPDDISIQALSKFYATPKEILEEAFSRDPLYQEIKGNLSMNFSFQLNKENILIAEKQELFCDMNMDKDSDPKTGICLITGNKGEIVRLSTATPLHGNSNTAALVSMQEDSGYDSYGKERAYNAPVSTEAEFAYTTAIKCLLDDESRNKAKIGDRMFLFWSVCPDPEMSEEINDSVFSFLTPETDKKADPNQKTERILKLFKSIWSGEIKTSLDDRFYILGLAPNVGRIAVVSWIDTCLKDFARKVLDHFEYMDIVDYRKPESRKPYQGILQMLSAVTLGGKFSDSLPNLAESLMDTVINGNPYPFPLYTGALDRIKAELSDTTVSIGRAAILKAYLNRNNSHNKNYNPLTAMLDKTYSNQGYLCGRLTAVLEKIQKDAQSGDSIRTRYMAAASATPATVFPAMLNVSVHHSEKLSEGSRIFYEQLKQEIMNLLPAEGFPSHLDLNDQGRFFVGYYHQLAELFTKKESK